MRCSSTAAMLAAMARATDISFCAYSIRPQGPVMDALRAAARRGAQVQVRLNGCFDHGGSRAMSTGNARAVHILRALHADARLVHTAQNRGVALHLKAAVCDRVAFLDDRNWTSASENIVLQDDRAADVLEIRNAIEGAAARSTARLALNKDRALRAEAAALAGAHAVDVATETLGYGSYVYGTLARLAASGARVRLLISPEDLGGSHGAAAAALACNGVDVRVSRSSEKFAVSSSGTAWVGSANATSPRADNSVDWGYTSRSKRLQQTLRRHFAQEWKHARPLSAVG